MSVNTLLNNPALGWTNLSVNSLSYNPLTSTQITALTPNTGELIFNSTNDKMQFYDGTNWNVVSSSSGGSGPVSQWAYGSISSAQILAGSAVLAIAAVNNNVIVPEYFSLNFLAGSSAYTSPTGTMQLQYYANSEVSTNVIISPTIPLNTLIPGSGAGVNTFCAVGLGNTTLGGTGTALKSNVQITAPLYFNFSTTQSTGNGTLSWAIKYFLQPAS